MDNEDKLLKILDVHLGKVKVAINAGRLVQESPLDLMRRVGFHKRSSIQLRFVESILDDHDLEMYPNFSYGDPNQVRFYVDRRRKVRYNVSLEALRDLDLDLPRYEDRAYIGEYFGNAAPVEVSEGVTVKQVLGKLSEVKNSSNWAYIVRDGGTAVWISRGMILNRHEDNVVDWKVDGLLLPELNISEGYEEHFPTLATDQFIAPFFELMDAGSDAIIAKGYLEPRSPRDVLESFRSLLNWLRLQKFRFDRLVYEGTED